MSELLFTSVLKRVLLNKLSYKNEFDLQDSERARKKYFTKARFETVI